MIRKGRGDLVLLSLEGYERMVAKLKQHDEYDPNIDALWMRKTETRYEEIATGKVVCSPLKEAVEDACTFRQ